VESRLAAKKCDSSDPMPAGELQEWALRASTSSTDEHGNVVCFQIFVVTAKCTLSALLTFSTGRQSIGASLRLFSQQLFRLEIAG
jgi:hypothetical protein